VNEKKKKGNRTRKTQGSGGLSKRKNRHHSENPMADEAPGKKWKRHPPPKFSGKRKKPETGRSEKQKPRKKRGEPVSGGEWQGETRG